MCEPSILLLGSVGCKKTVKQLIDTANWTDTSMLYIPKLLGEKKLGSSGQSERSAGARGSSAWLFES